MTSTISPHDTGDIPVGEQTRDLTALAIAIRRPPPVRRPAATGEYPIYRPETIAVVDGPTEPPAPAPVAVEPPRYQGDHRKSDPVWAWALIGAGLLLLGEALAAVAVVLVVAW